MKGKNREKNKRKAIVEAIERNALTTGHTDSMIRRITLRDVATYGHKGVKLENLQRVNFIYGGNGAGKTTLSRLLAGRLTTTNSCVPEKCGECLRGTGKFKNCEVEWTEMPLKVLVYNRDFRERNLMENIPGVFTLGEDSVEAEKKLEALQKELDLENMNLTSKNKRIEAREKQIRQDVKRLKETLWNEVLMPQNDYFGECLKDAVTSKDQFAKQMQAMVDDGRYKMALGRASLQERYRTLYRGEQLMVIPPMRKPEEEYNAMADVMANEIWQKSIVANADKATEACRRCEKRPVGKDFLKVLADYLDDDYKKDVEEIRRLMHAYEENASRVKESIYGQMSYCQGYEGGVGKHLPVMQMLMEVLDERMDTNYRIMLNKLENPTMVAPFKDIGGQVGSLWQIIAETNKEIEEYNEMVRNREPERARLKHDLMVYLAGRSASTVKYCNQTVAQKNADLVVLRDEAGTIMKKTRALVEEIKGLEKKLASTKPTVDRINNELRRYGFTGFSIQQTKKGNTYQIQREDGSLVKDTLSEGETTFITFLYYLQLVKGGETTSNVQEKKVLVIDDPISSLDDKVMGAVSDMVRQVISKVDSTEFKGESFSDINQVFVLTHNTDFYKKVTWVNPRSNKRRGHHHWMLTKLGDETCVNAFGMENPVKMGYEQTWRELKEGVASGRQIHSLMRNIIETYFVEYGGFEKNKLIADHFTEDDAERTKMTALMEWIDTGCHTGEEALYAEAPIVANRRRMEEFRRLFEKLGQLEHFRMMMGEKGRDGITVNRTNIGYGNRG
jgi:wobble nucleotide-excising tRNase